MPSIDMTSEMKNRAAYLQLPELVKRIRNLEKALDSLRGTGKDEK
jgi:hypothetical protein